MDRLARRILSLHNQVHEIRRQLDVLTSDLISGGDVYPDVDQEHVKLLVKRFESQCDSLEYESELLLGHLHIYFREKLSKTSFDQERGAMISKAG